MQVKRLSNDELYHHGVKGQRWGIRRYQNPDGSYTDVGRRHYGLGEKMDTNDKRDSSVTRRVKNDYNNMSDNEFKGKYQVSKNRYRKRVNRYGDPYMNSPLAKYGKKEAAKQKAIDEKVREETKSLTDKQIKARRNLMIAGVLATGAVSLAAIRNSDKIVKAGNKAYNALKDNYGNKKVTAMVDGKKVKGIVENAPGLSTKVARSAKNQDTIDQYKALGVAAGALAGQIAISNKSSRRGQAYTRELAARKKKKAKQQQNQVSR